MACYIQNNCKEQGSIFISLKEQYIYINECNAIMSLPKACARLEVTDSLWSYIQVLQRQGGAPFRVTEQDRILI